MGVRSAIFNWLQGGTAEPIKAPRRRMYGGAKFSRLTADWVTGNTSADSEIYGSAQKLRDRVRQLCRDNDYARQALRAIESNVIGQGVPFQSQVRMQRGGRLDQRLNNAIEELWKEWGHAKSCHTAGKLSFHDIERLAIRSVAESGEVFIRIVRQSFAGSKVPLALEVLEADLLDDGLNGRSQQGNEIRMGIEVDEWGRPVAYHFLAYHPGDYQFSNQQISTQRHKRVLADDVIHLYRTDRPGQTRGVSWFASAIERLHHLSGYEQAEVVRARASSALMGFITSPEGELIGDEVFDGDRVSGFEPGVFKYLAPGESVTVPQLDAPDGQFEPFVRAMLRAMAAGIGCSFETISRDFSQTNFSSSRLSLLEDRDHWRNLQRWMIDTFHQRVFDVWLDMAVLNGALSLPQYDLQPERYRHVRWMPRGWSWVDPQKEVQAYKEAVRCGFKTLADVVAEQGGDLEELFEARQRETELAVEMGLVFDTDPATAAAAPSQVLPELVSGEKQPITDDQELTADEPDEPVPDRV
jgi:lambda family phage portal protein